MPIGRDLDLTQVGGEGIGFDLMRLRSLGQQRHEVLQVLGGGAIAADST